MTVDVTKDRLGKIGGSDLPAVLGHDPYRTPYMAWMDITGKSPPKPMNDHMLRGKCKEQGIATYVAAKMNENRPETDPHVIVVTPTARLVHPDYPFIIGNPDRYLLDQANCVAIVLEAKSPERVDWEEPPARYLIQLASYVTLAQTIQPEGMEFTSVGCLGVDHGPIDIIYKETDILRAEENHRYAADWHKRYVQGDVAPPLTTIEDVAIAHPDSVDGKTVVASEEEAAWLLALADADAEAKAAEAKAEHFKERLAILLGDSEALVGPDGKVLATRKASTKRSFDFGGFRMTYPDIAAQFDTTKTVRSTLLKREAIREFAGGVQF